MYRWNRPKVRYDWDEADSIDSYATFQIPIVVSIATTGTFFWRRSEIA